MTAPVAVAKVGIGTPDAAAAINAYDPDLHATTTGDGSALTIRAVSIGGNNADYREAGRVQRASANVIVSPRRSARRLGCTVFVHTVHGEPVKIGLPGSNGNTGLYVLPTVMVADVKRIIQASTGCPTDEQYLVRCARPRGRTQTGGCQMGTRIKVQGGRQL